MRPFLEKKNLYILLGIAKFLVLRRKKNEKSQSHFSAFKIKLLFKYSWEFNVKNYKVGVFLESAMFKENTYF